MVMFSPPFQAKLSTSIKFLAKAQSKLKMHLPFVHLPWNTMPVPPQFCIHCTFVFYFSWVFQSSQEKLKTMHMHGGKKRCTTVDVQVVNVNGPWWLAAVVLQTKSNLFLVKWKFQMWLQCVSGLVGRGLICKLFSISSTA